MVSTERTGTILDKIVDHKRTEVEAAKQQQPMDEVLAAARDAPATRGFAAALQQPGISLIAEVKRASPSAGALRNNLDPAAVARTYAAGGAAAISVLTDHRFFHGSLDDLRAVRRAVPLPLLRKDFSIDVYQIAEARVTGADAVLLIAAILDVDALLEFQSLAHELGMAALVEVHNRAELTRALAADAAIIGVNSRDLHTFEVSLDTIAALRPEIPTNKVVVAESGIHSAADVTRLSTLGIDAMLVGTSLITAESPEGKVRELVTAGAA